MEKASRKKVGFFSKIGFKMVLIIALAGAVISAVTMFMIVPRSTKQIELMTKNEMTNLAQAYSTDLNDKLMEKRVLSYDGYANILRNVKISGLDTSYAYLVDEEGIMRYKGRLFVLVQGELKRELLKEAHYSSYSIHPGGNKMCQDLKKFY